MIGIVCFNSLRYAQYLFKYTIIFDRLKIPYEVLFWNREGENNDIPSNWIAFNETVNTFIPFYKKIFKFVKFNFFLRKEIKKRKYDRLIILTTPTAISLFTLLLTKFSKRYIYDYRDITYENNPLYKFLVKKLISKASFTTISSEGFKRVIGASKNYVTAHNTRDFNQVSNNTKRCINRPIKVAYWGMVRQPGFNCRICDLFERDSRFLLVYHGAGYHQELINYCKQKNYSRISFTGAYSLNELDVFAQNTDIILNAYENDEIQKLAVTVKFYDSIKYKIPMIVTAGSYMSDIVDEHDLGFSIDWGDDNCLDKLYQLIEKFNWESYFQNVVKYASKIYEDDFLFEQKILKFCELG